MGSLTTSSVFCKEVFEEDFQPSKDGECCAVISEILLVSLIIIFPLEIHEYARKIGIDPEKEPYLLNIAVEGLMKALPEEWKPW